MKWMGTLKRMCRNSRQSSGGDNFKLELSKSEKVADKKRIAWQWMYIAFIISMATVAHIFEIPFMVFDPDSFKSPGTFAKTGNLTGSDLNASIATTGNYFATNETFLDSNKSAVESYTLHNVTATSETTTKGPQTIIMRRLDRILYKFYCTEMCKILLNRPHYANNPKMSPIARYSYFPPFGT